MVFEKSLNELLELYCLNSELSSYYRIIEKYTPSENLTTMIAFRKETISKILADIHSHGILESEITLGYPDYDRSSNCAKIEKGFFMLHREALHYCETINLDKKMIEIHRKRVLELRGIIDNNFILEAIVEGKTEEEARAELAKISQFVDQLKGDKS